MWWLFFSDSDRSGFDFGLKCFLTSSDGSKLESPQHLKQELSKLKKLSKQCSKKKKGSSGQKKAYIKLTRLYRDIENKRRDFAFKSTLELVRKYDVLVFEDLNISGMKKLWGRKVSDIAFASWLNTLQYRCLQFNKRLIKVDRYFPSSKTCFECGEINKDLLLSDREWICPVCGAKLDRDLNAAKNLERAGASSLGLGGVSLGKPSILC